METMVLLLICTVLAFTPAQAYTSFPWTTYPSLPQLSTETAWQCGGTLTQSRGQFTSPNYPQSYPNNAHCTWNIRASGYRTIYLEFSYFLLETTPGCGYDRVSVYDGPSSSYPLLGRICGGQKRTYNSTRNYMTVVFESDSSSTYKGFEAFYSFHDVDSFPGYSTAETQTTAWYPDVTTSSSGSCRHYCGYHLGSCSCYSSCRYYGDCCHDYYDYCYATTPDFVTTTDVTASSSGSCRHYCGYHLGSCSCYSSCRYYGDCCHDYYDYCYATTPDFVTTTAAALTTDSGSCRYNCGYDFGSCSCSSSCSYYGNCCPDFCGYCSSLDYGYCYGTPTPSIPTLQWDTTTASSGSCRNNCYGYSGNCSCSSSCSNHGNCCNDFCDYCPYVNHVFCYPITTPTSTPSTVWGSCNGNCYGHSGNCSCSSNCSYHGNCCNDFCDYCFNVDSSYCFNRPGYCGGNLGGSSGSFSSPNYPNNYNNGANCIWHITVPNGQKVFLTFTDFELESCGSCGCDSVSIYDGRTSSSPLIAKICQNTTSDSYHSTSHYMTVVFRTDGSAVRRGFRAIYSSTVPVYGARVECSSDAMRVIIQNSYLDSMGLTGNDLYLNDQYCRPVFSSSHVTFNVPLNSCGTVREDSRGRITYINDVRAFVSSSGEITRQSHMQLRVGCRMQQDTMVQIMYVARERVTGNITGSGNYNVKMAFYTSSNFYYPVTMSPYVVDLNQFLYVQAQLQSSDSNLVIFLDTCVASPSPTDFLTRTYDLIRDGCRKDSSFYSYVSGTSTVAQFRFSAFKFIRSHPSVYLQCRIAVCNAYDNYSRCKQGCQPRKRRDLSSSHEKTTVVLGPIQLRDPTKPDKETLVQAIV
ncbi:deleted in malignant brain tumors 1 protein-like [Lepisosteus oculatus]|uniref:deleted in malignant brain tumors 1 protein-like n=1 Tax=Lepisosteus oculatus TaxID=7918 RepID=UPI00371843D3